MVTVTPSIRPTWMDPAHCGLTTATVANVTNALSLTLALETGLVGSLAPLSHLPVVFLSAADAVVATLVYELLTGRITDADRAFFRVAVAALAALSLLDIGFLYIDPGATVPGVLVLMLVYVVVAAVCVASLIELGWDAPKGAGRTSPKSDRTTVVRALFRMS